MEELSYVLLLTKSLSPNVVQNLSLGFRFSSLIKSVLNTPPMSALVECVALLCSFSATASTAASAPFRVTKCGQRVRVRVPECGGVGLLLLLPGDNSFKINSSAACPGRRLTVATLQYYIVNSSPGPQRGSQARPSALLSPLRKKRVREITHP